MLLRPVVMIIVVVRVLGRLGMTIVKALLIVVILISAHSELNVEHNIFRPGAKIEVKF